MHMQGDMFDDGEKMFQRYDEDGVEIKGEFDDDDSDEITNNYDKDEDEAQHWIADCPRCTAIEASAMSYFWDRDIEVGVCTVCDYHSKILDPYKQKIKYHLKIKEKETEVEIMELPDKKTMQLGILREPKEKKEKE